MKSAKRYGWYFLLGACAYWGTDALIQLIHPPHIVWISLLTFGVPFVVWSVWFRLYRAEGYNQHPKAFPLFMLFGVWALGPLLMGITAQLQGGTFLEAGKIGQFLIVWAMFPATTFMMSTYSGSLGGLVISTIMLFILSSVGSNKLKASNKAPQPTPKSGAAEL